jgi:hypothetical protein
MEDGTGGWIKPHNVSLYNLYSSSNIITVFKSCWMRWIGGLGVGTFGTEQEWIKGFGGKIGRKVTDL